MKNQSIKSAETGTWIGPRWLTGATLAALLAVVAVIAMVVAARGNGGDQQAGGFVVARTGGTVTADDGVTSVYFPPDSLPADEAVTVETLNGGELPDMDRSAVYGGARFGPHGIAFSRPATITIALAAKLDPGSVLDLLYLNEARSGYDNLGARATVNESGLSASAQVEHFSTYALGGTPRLQPKKDPNTGKPIPGHYTLRLKVGQSFSFTLGPNLSNVVAGPAVAGTPPCATASITGGKGDRDVSDTIKITATAPGAATVTLTAEKWLLNHFGNRQQKKPGQVGHWVTGDITIDVTCVGDPPDVPTGVPGPGNNGGQQPGPGQPEGMPDPNPQPAPDSTPAPTPEPTPEPPAPPEPAPEPAPTPCPTPTPAPDQSGPQAPAPDCTYLGAAGPFGSTAEANEAAASQGTGSGEINGVPGHVTYTFRTVTLSPNHGVAIWVDFWWCPDK